MPSDGEHGWEIEKERGKAREGEWVIKCLGKRRAQAAARSRGGGERKGQRERERNER